MTRREQLEADWARRDEVVARPEFEECGRLLCAADDDPCLYEMRCERHAGHDGRCAGAWREVGVREVPVGDCLR